VACDTLASAPEETVAKTFVNVPMDPENEERVQREEDTWTGPRLMIFGSAFLGICLVILYVLANLTTWTGTHQP
jgi:hypothetical protein